MFSWLKAHGRRDTPHISFDIPLSYTLLLIELFMFSMFKAQVLKHMPSIGAAKGLHITLVMFTALILLGEFESEETLVGESHFEWGLLLVNFNSTSFYFLVYSLTFTGANNGFHGDTERERPRHNHPMDYLDNG